MSLLQGLTDIFQGFQEWTSKDEIVFGEIVRIFVKKGWPVIGFSAEPGMQSARFFINNDVPLVLLFPLCSWLALRVRDGQRSSAAHLLTGAALGGVAPIPTGVGYLLYTR